MVAFVQHEMQLFRHHVPESHHLVPAVVLFVNVGGEEDTAKVFQAAQQ